MFAGKVKKLLSLSEHLERNKKTSIYYFLVSLDFNRLWKCFILVCFIACCYITQLTYVFEHMNPSKA